MNRILRGRGRGRGGSGVTLLAFQLLHIGLENIPPVTLSLIAFQTMLYINPLNWYLPTRIYCLSAHHIIKMGQWGRIVTASVLHGDDWHLYYNMLSFTWKGRKLEPVYGSVAFACLVMQLVILSGLFYVGLVKCLLSFYGTHAPLIGPDCCIGFSAVLFGLKVWMKSSPQWINFLFV